MRPGGARLSAFARARVVLGNNDGPEVAAWGAPEILEFELDGLRIGMIHDAGSKDARLARMHQLPDCNVVIFGHSHIPLDAADDHLLIFNPGSPTDKRRQPHRTLGRADHQRRAGGSATIHQFPKGWRGQPARPEVWSSWSTGRR